MPVPKNEFTEKWNAFRQDAATIAITIERNLAYDIAIENDIPMGQVFTPEREQEWNRRSEEVRKKYGL